MGFIGHIAWGSDYSSLPFVSQCSYPASSVWSSVAISIIISHSAPFSLSCTLRLSFPHRPMHHI